MVSQTPQWRLCFLDHYERLVKQEDSANGLVEVRMTLLHTPLVLHTTAVCHFEMSTGMCHQRTLPLLSLCALVIALLLYKTVFSLHLVNSKIFRHVYCRLARFAVVARLFGVFNVVRGNASLLVVK